MKYIYKYLAFMALPVKKIPDPCSRHMSMLYFYALYISFYAVRVILMSYFLRPHCEGRSVIILSVAKAGGR